MGTPLRLLLIEDHENDALLIVRELKRGDYEVAWERVETAGALAAAVSRQSWDLITCDWVLPLLDGAVALTLLREWGVGAPIIVVSGEVGEEFAVTAMKNGAHDFISKHRLTRLVPAVERELREAAERRARQQAEAALRESEARFALIADTIGEAFWMADVEIAQMFYISPGYERIWGRTTRSLYADPRSFLDAAHPDDRERMRAALTLQKNGQPFEHEYRILRPDGAIRWIWDRGFPIRDATGTVTRYVGIAQDITDRKHTEEALRNSQEHLKLLFESAPDAYYLTDANGCFVDLNRASEELAGYQREELIGHSVLTSNLIAPEDRSTIATLLQTSLSRAAGPREVTITRKDRRRVTVEVRTLPVRINGQTLVLGIARDITQRKWVNAQLALQSTALMAAANAIVITDTNGTIVWLNAAFSRLTGYDSAEALGGTPRLLKSGVHDRSFYEHLWTTIRAGHVWSGDLVNRRKDGTLYNEEMTITPVRQGDDITHFIAIKQDTTERKRAREEVERLYAHLEQRVVERTAQLEAVNRELEAFAHSVSHDLRAPLRHIEGFSRALREEYAPQLDAQGQHYLDRIQAGTEHMGQLIQDLLSLARVTRAEMVVTRVHLSELVQSIAAELQRTQPNRRVEVTIAPGLVAAGDARLLRAALENLLANAWKYTSKHPTARIEFGTIEYQGRVAYFLRDDGAGFEMAHAGKLFVAFQRLHTAAEFEGTGIGLATVQRIIHRHRGHIWAEGAPEQGATFYFVLGTEGTDTAIFANGDS